MRTFIHIVAAASLIAVPAIAARQTSEQQFARLTAGRSAGKPVDCIRLLPSSDSMTIPHKAVAYRDGSTWYVNSFHDDCPELSDDMILITRTPTNQLCRGDTVELRSRSSQISFGACIFDSFTPYRRNS